MPEGAASSGGGEAFEVSSARSIIVPGPYPQIGAADPAKMNVFALAAKRAA
jgi:hypothetical protein